MNLQVVSPSSVDSPDRVEPIRFAEHGYPYGAWATSRAETPVAYLELGAECPTAAPQMRRRIR